MSVRSKRPRASIRYRSGYKYQLAADYTIPTEIRPATNIYTQRITLTTAGILTIRNGYAWDGPSGPVVDTRANMRASVVHDALYQLMRHLHLSAKMHRKAADQLFKDLCIADGVPRLVAHLYYKGLRWGGKPATDPKNRKKISRAP